MELATEHARYGDSDNALLLKLATAAAAYAEEPVVIAPVNTVAPVVTTNGANAPGGPAFDGDILSTTEGTWTGSPTITYQWRYASTGDISFATNSTYVTSPVDVGLFIYCRVTGTNGGGAASADSNSIVVT